jgi:hypothetical protein
MKKLSICLALATLAWPVSAQDQSGDVLVHMVVTAESRHGRQTPLIEKGEVSAYQGREKVKVEDWLPLRGDHAALELFILLDDVANTSLATQLEDIRTFIEEQPPTTAVGVGYMQNGTVQVTSNLTTDHVAAAKSLRMPLSSPVAMASPYFSLEDLIKKWPAAQARREVIMITDGIDRFGGSNPYNPYVETCIEETIKAGILVYTIYTPGIGHYGHSFWAMNWGQNYLAELSEKTGAESYFIGFGNPVTFVPWFNQIEERLQNQYLITFFVKPDKKPSFQRVRFTTEVPETEIIGAESVWVPEGAK